MTEDLYLSCLYSKPLMWCPVYNVILSGLILGLCPANERWHYFVTTPLIGWVQAYNQPWLCCIETCSFWGWQWAVFAPACSTRHQHYVQLKKCTLHALLCLVVVWYRLVLYIYCKISNIRRTKSQNLNVSRLSLQLSLRNILKLSVKWRMKM